MVTGRMCGALLLFAALSGSALPGTATAAPPAAGDVTVVAVIDDGFSPYHWDFLAAKMPQARTRQRSDDLPLSTPPAEWIPGFPGRSAFTTVTPLRLSLEQRDANTEQATLYARDRPAWDAVAPSGPGALNYYWIPGTKVVGAMSFGPETPLSKAGHAVANPYYERYVPIYGPKGSAQHGMGSASVAVGNFTGTCPECVLVFLQYEDLEGADRAMRWAMAQPWIDVVTNSYSCDAVQNGLVRDGVCGLADPMAQRAASMRGQTIFWAAGNGTDSSFVTPHQTLLSSQKGPDWIVTVTGTDVRGQAYSGAGKPADLAGVASAYPSAFQSTRLTGGRPFSGTSNATPVVAGTYARALYLARRALAGPSAVQAAGTVARGRARCGRAWRGCPIGDGRLTATELRLALLHGARHRTSGASVGGVADVPAVADDTYAHEGHGSYLGRVALDDRVWQAELNRVLHPLFGHSRPPARPAAERQWMVVDSWCRQRLWGEWTGGYHQPRTPVPPVDPQRTPMLAVYRYSCEQLVRPPGDR